MDLLIEKVLNANPGREVGNIDRRCLKLCEETGEAAQAVLAVTSENNHKNMTWADVREELSDTVIVALDMLLTQMPDQSHMTEEQRILAIYDELDRKLAKWALKRSNHAKSDDAA